MCKELISDETGHSLILGQSLFVSVSVRQHVTHHSYQVIVRICLSKSSLFCASWNTLTLLTEKEFNIISRSAQYLLMLQSTNKNLVTDVSGLYANKALHGSVFLSSVEYKQLENRNPAPRHGAKKQRNETKKHATDQRGSRVKARHRWDIKIIQILLFHFWAS